MVEILLAVSVIINIVLSYMLWSAHNLNRDLQGSFDSEFMRGQATAYAEMLEKIKGAADK